MTTEDEANSTEEKRAKSLLFIEATYSQKIIEAAQEFRPSIQLKASEWEESLYAYKTALLEKDFEATEFDYQNPEEWEIKFHRLRIRKDYKRKLHGYKPELNPYDKA